MYHLSTLPSGLRIVTVPSTAVASITVLVLVGAGSRYEEFNHNGISHFLEHMFFKGAKDYKTPKDVSLAIDSVGGVFNAFTDKELAGYYVKVAAEHKETAMHVLSDMLIHATFPSEEIEKEKGVILEELNMYQDSPRQQIGWDFERLLFGNQPLGWDEGGRPEWIKKATREEFIAYRNPLYTPDNTVVAIAGNITPEEAYALTEQYFAEYTGQKSSAYVPLNHSMVGAERLFVKNKPTDQAHLILGTEGISYHDEDSSAMSVLTSILGGNSSSRLFQNVREEKGLCYYVYSANSSYSDTGTFYVSSGVSIGKIKDAVSAIRSELEHAAQTPFTQEELDNAKSYLKGTMALSLEDTEQLAYFYGRQLLLKNVMHTYEERAHRIDLVELQDLHRLAQKHFVEQKLSLSIIGPYEDLSMFSPLIS